MTTLSTRRYDLDWLRVIAFGLLIFYHIGMFYVTWDWHVKSVHASAAAEPLMRLLNPWRLSLLFFISGVAIRFAIDKTPRLFFATQRLYRLALPILFGMALIVAPQSWLQLVESGEFIGNFWVFYPHYLDLSSDYSVTTPTWNHLWYVVYLLAYTLILSGLYSLLSRIRLGSAERILREMADKRSGALLVTLAPVLPLILIRFTLTPHFPTTHAFWGDWANHANSFYMVLLGFMVAKSDIFWAAVRKSLPIVLGLTAILAFVLSFLWLDWEQFFTAAGEPDHWIVQPARIGRVLYTWVAITSLLGLAQYFLNRPSRGLTYLTDAVFPWYILHQTLIVMAGYWLTRQGLNAWVEFAAVLAATWIGCIVLHECVIRRVGFLRPLFGLKGRPPNAPRSYGQLKRAT